MTLQQVKAILNRAYATDRAWHCFGCAEWDWLVPVLMETCVNWTDPIDINQVQQAYTDREYNRNPLAAEQSLAWALNHEHPDGTKCPVTLLIGDHMRPTEWLKKRLIQHARERAYVEELPYAAPTDSL